MDSGPLAGHLRDLIAGDEELREHRARLEAYIFRGLTWHDFQGRRHATSRLSRLAPSLPKLIQPAAYTAATVDELAADPCVSHLNDQRGALLAHSCRRRLVQILTMLFDDLRAAQLDAIGRAPSNPAMQTDIPPDLWASPAMAVEAPTGDVLVGDTRAFIDVVVQQPLPKPALRVSAAAVERFVTTFAAELLAAGRRFSSAELLAAAEAEGIGPSANVVVERLRHLRPSAWARRGRRSAAEVPTPIEIAAAARQAREAVNRR